VDYKDVTELSGEEISQEQLQRICNRYYWAGSYCQGKDTLEVACGTGPGLGYLSRISQRLVAGDISEEILSIARLHYEERVEIQQFDASSMPFPNQSFDVVLIFEAIYYLPNVEQFMKECRRILRPAGILLIVTANKDLYDFNPSPYSYGYYGVLELERLLSAHNFEAIFYGSTSVKTTSFKQKIFRPMKKIASALNLIPQTMKRKSCLKRLVFGKLVPMPYEIDSSTRNYEPPVSLVSDHPDRVHKVIFCAAHMKN
jgi:ubiquinone/menaquinone biosynthesis C-methylase UbiE